MRCEIPVLLRCCFCFPLRHGLLVWAYVKEIFSLMFLIFTIWRFSKTYKRLDTSWEVIYPIIITLTVVDILFHVLFIISAHTKDYRKMRIFYRYSIVFLCLNAILFILFISLCIFYIYMSLFIFIFLWSLMLPTFLMILITIVIQIYLIILIKSEVIKLKNNSQFEFVNHAAEEKCTANIDFVTIIPG
ncbi:uncharacterized protein LOC112054970 isoform X2 [Bicyclus anynana]|uniref:Uncharacterized protein LOC112054970 isoform X2 n=1 Tax=Bicyclus anynana TaxID=110368 RepID=A0A6J1NVF3_BICAN|nr:uncharacterized protein LOC112054970 isoform X2 [Bicyclus anynana]